MTDICGKAIATKMLAIMSDVQYIQKTGINKFLNYKYAKESDISEAFSKSLIKHKVFMFSSIVDYGCKAFKTKKDEDRFLITVKLNVKFVDAESGESFESVFYGDGADSDDKGVYKAITGAQKYALLKTFMVSTGDDPEQDREPEPAHTSIVTSGASHNHYQQRLHDLIMQCKEPAITRQFICDKCGVDSLTALKEAELKFWIGSLEEKLGEV